MMEGEVHNSAEMYLIAESHSQVVKAQRFGLVTVLLARSQHQHKALRLDDLEGDSIINYISPDLSTYL